MHSRRTPLGASMDFGEQKFRKQIGQSATIQRGTEKGERPERANLKLDELGQMNNPVPGSLKYMGSAAVHIYWNEALQQVFFVSQTAPLKVHKCPEVLAQTGIKDLIGATLEAYGHKRPRLRSGF